MNGTWTVLRAEAYRLSRTRSLWVALLLLAALAFVVGVLTEPTLTGANDMTRGRGWISMAEGLHAGLVLGTLALAFVGARSLAGDREAWVLRLTVTRSASRTGVAMGRLLLGPPLVAILVVTTFAGAWLAGALSGGYGDLVVQDYVMVTGPEIRAETGRALLAVLAPLVAAWCFGLAVSSWSPTATASVAVTLATLLALDLFKPLLGTEPWLFSAYLPALIGETATSQLTVLAEANSDGWLQEEIFRRSWMHPLPQAGLLAGLTALGVRRRAL